MTPNLYDFSFCVISNYPTDIPSWDTDSKLEFDKFATYFSTDDTCIYAIDKITNSDDVSPVPDDYKKCINTYKPGDKAKYFQNF